MPGRAREHGSDANSGSNKRARSEPSRGAICKIRVHNFMTYVDAEIVPGPRLNLVLGPNGTGKSSLVNAICLGLAGSTQLLGRADNVRDFVRRGEKEGYVQIWLSTGQPGRSVCIKRHMHCGENKSEWRINGNVVTFREIKEKVKDLHVQLENLCQFLPQDKVVEFAKLKPEQLLEETQKAVGDSSLHDRHCALIEECCALKAIETSARVSQQELDVLERANEGLKRDVSRVERKELLEKEVKSLEDKLAWTEFKDFKAHHQEAKGEFQLNTDRLANMRVKADQAAAPMRKKEDKKSKALESVAAHGKKLKKSEEDIGKARTALDDHVGVIDEKIVKLEGLDTEHDKWQADIRKAVTDIKNLEEQVDEASQAQATQTQASQAEQNAEAKRLDGLRREATAKMNMLQHQADTKREERDQVDQEVVTFLEQMRRLTNTKLQRLRSLEMGFVGITSLTSWLERPEAKAMFKGQVYGPILCEVTVDSPQNAAWLEQHCPRDLWARFVTEFPEDQDRLAKESFERFKFKPIVTNLSGNVNDVIRHRFGDSSTFSNHGIVSTLDEVFQAPQTVKLAMCNEAALNETYCGNRSINPERFLEQHPNISRLLTPDAMYIVRRSRYNSSARSMNVTGAYPASLLAPGGTANLDQEKHALQINIDDANSRKAARQSQLDVLEADAHTQDARICDYQERISAINTELNAERSRRSKLTTSLKARKRQLANLQAKPDPHDKAPGLEAEIKKLCSACCEAIAKLSDLNATMLKLHIEHIAAEATARECTSQVKSMHREQQERQRNLKTLQDLMNEMAKKIEDEKELLQRMKKDAIDRTGPMSQAIKDQFAKLPGKKEEIEDMISLKKAEVDAIQLANPHALEEYNKRRQEIAKLSKTCKDQQEKLAIGKSSIEAKKAAWLPELHKVIAEVNKNFGRSFQRIGCAGEVVLYEAVDPVTQQEDFDKFAVHIRVRFRANEDMQLLTSHRQSGGERSVSTILYLIAIQNVTVCPFRVVDEINQGMDPINERKVFMQLVEAACQPNTPQCFLLTPKLLPDLPFSEHVTLLQIFNGPLISEVRCNFNASKIIGGRTPVAASAG